MGARAHKVAYTARDPMVQRAHGCARWAGSLTTIVELGALLLPGEPAQRFRVTRHRPCCSSDGPRVTNVPSITSPLWRPVKVVVTWQLQSRGDVGLEGTGDSPTRHRDEVDAGGLRGPHVREVPRRAARGPLRECGRCTCRR